MEPPGIALAEIEPESTGTVVVVADDEVVAQRLLGLLRSGGSRASWATDADGIAERAPCEQPRTVLLWFRGLTPAKEALGRLRKLPALRIVVVAREVTAAEVRELFAAGVDGLALDHNLEAVLLPTLDGVAAGQLVLPRSHRGQAARPTLSTREKQVLGLVVLGLSNQDVALKLHVTEATVKSHLTSSFRKLGVRSRSEAAARILDPQDGLGIGILSLGEADTNLDVFAEA